MSVTAAQATTLLENVLFESATLAAANASGWASLSALNASYSTVASLAAAMAATQEAAIGEQVVRYYEGALGRSPSGAEVAYYVGIAETGLTATQISQGAVPAATWNTIASYFAASPEFQFATAGTDTVDLLYLNILGRTPSAAELSYYQGLQASGTSVSTLVQYFTTSPEYQAKVNTQIASDLSTYGTAVVGGTTPTNIGSVSAATPTTTTLTTGIDTPSLTGNNNTINGLIATTGSTYTAGDTLVAAAGSTGNILNLSITTSSDPTALAGVTVSGIQTLNITASQAQTANTASSIVGFSGLTNLNVKDVGGSTITAATTTAISVTDLTQSNAAETIQGGSTVTLTTTGMTTAVGGGNAAILIGSTSAPVGAVVVTTNDTLSNGATGGAIQTTGGTTVGITETNTGLSASQSATFGNVTVTGTSATTTVSVSQGAPATASSTVVGLADGTVTVNDANAGSSTKAGTITSVTLSNYATS